MSIGRLVCIHSATVTYVSCALFCVKPKLPSRAPCSGTRIRSVARIITPPAQQTQFRRGAAGGRRTGIGRITCAWRAGTVAEIKVHEIEERFADEIAADVFNQHFGSRLRHGGCYAGDVRRHEHARFGPERMSGWQWLHREHIEPGASEAARAEGFEQG